jgi:hypothetical protein
MPDIIGDRWKIMRPLRSPGGQSVTFLVKDLAGSKGLFVLKQPDLKRHQPQQRTPELLLTRFKIEVGILTAVRERNHPNIVGIFDSNVEVDTPWFVMPYYPAGAMKENKRNPLYLEQYAGNIDRVLTIARDVASALAFLQESSPGFVHRDIKCGNIFFDRVGGPAILGDFGLAFVDEPTDNHKTPVHDRVGPKDWRPPEVRRGGIDKHHSGTDIYLLGGVIYESLTGGETLDEVETAGDFAHERVEFSIARFCNGDPRAGFVSMLLRHMFRRDPGLRLDARTVVQVCNEIVNWTTGGTVSVQPPISSLEAAAAEFRAKQEFITDRVWQEELRATATRVMKHFNLLNGEAAPGHFARQVYEVRGDGYEMILKERYPGSSWYAVRPLVIFRASAQKYIQYMSHVFVGRLNPDEEMVLVRTEDGDYGEMGNSAPNSREIFDAMVTATSDELVRLEQKVASEIDALL